MDVEQLKKQYQLVKESRNALLQYCDTIANEDLIKRNTNFGSGSISNLLSHIANCYLFWISQQALQKETSFLKYDDKPSIIELKQAFESVDFIMNEFFNWLSAEQPSEIIFHLREDSGTSTPLRLFTHTITHEFHHKGQIMSLSRHLGYTPVDTDVMR